MQHLRLPLLVSAATLLSLPATAADLGEWSLNSEFSYVGAYVFRGAERADDSVQAGFRLYSDIGLYTGVWTNQPTDGSTDEYNLYLGGQTEIGGGFNLDAGFTYYHYKGAAAPATRRSYEAYVGVNRTLIGNLSGAVYFYGDFLLEAMTFEGSLGYTIPLPIERFPSSLDFSAFLGHSDLNDRLPDFPGPTLGDHFAYYGFTAELPVKFSDTVSIAAGVQYGDSMNQAGAANLTDNLWGYGSVRIHF